MLFASLIVMLLAFAHSDEMLRIVMIAFGALCASYDCPSGKRWSDEMLRIVMIAFGKF